MADERIARDMADLPPRDGAAGPPGATGSTGSTSGEARPTPGWREVLLVAVAIVAVSLGAAVVTGLLPASWQDVVFKTPLVIVVLIVGTVGLLVRLAMHRPPA